MQTDNAILDAEAQLVAEVGPSDEDSGDWRTPDYVELDPRLVLQTLRQDTHGRGITLAAHGCGAQLTKHTNSGGGL